MEDIANIQLPETVQSEDTRSEIVDYEEDTSNLDNSDSVHLKNESPTVSINDKTDEEKLIQNTDNLLNVSLNSPRATVLGKLKAKQRLQAFLLPKQNPFINSPVKKTEETPTKNEKSVKKTKKSPLEKAKSIIEELEEIKKVEIAKLLSPALFPERKSNYVDKSYCKKSRSRSLEFTRRVVDKGKYPNNWEEIKQRQLSLENVCEIKLNKIAKRAKHQDECFDFRKQLLFKSPSQFLTSLKVKGFNGPDKTVPSQYIRYTKASPSISYSASHTKYYENYISTTEVYGYIPNSHRDIIKQLRTDKCEKFSDDSPKKSVQKWYPKQPLNNITEGCELLEKSLSLSILQNYMDEEEDEDKNENDYENNIHLDNPKPNKDEVEDNYEKERSQIEYESSSNVIMESCDIVDKYVEKEDINYDEICNEKVQVDELSNIKQSKNKKDRKRKQKKDKKEKRENRKRKRKKEKHEKENKKKKTSFNKSAKKIINNELKKESKSKKKETGKPDKKNDVDTRKRHNKDGRNDKETNKDDKKEDKIQNKVELKKEDRTDDKENKRDIKREIRKEDRRDDKKEEKRDDKKEDKKGDKKEDKKDNKKEDKRNETKVDKKDDKKYIKKINEKNDRKYNKDEDKIVRNVKNKDQTSLVQLYYDEFESLSCRSLSKEKTDGSKKETQQKFQDSSRELKKKDRLNKDSKQTSKSTPSKGKKFMKHGHHDEKRKKIKEENLFKIEPLKPEGESITPDTDEYHSHWESDEDVSHVISYSPMLPKKFNTSWESDEEVLSPDKVLSNTRFLEQSLRGSDRSSERRSKKFLEGERSLEMPLNIMNVNRKDSRRLGKPLDFPERKLLNNDILLLYNEDSWERGEYLKICNDIEGEKLRHERKTLSEERRLLELEKRKLAEKLEKRSFNCDIFDEFEDSLVKEVTYEKIYTGNDDIYLKSTDYINDKRTKNRKEVEYDAKRKVEHESRKRTHIVEDNRKRYEDDSKKYKKCDLKKSRHDNEEIYDVKRENFVEDLPKIENKCETYDKIDKDSSLLTVTNDTYKISKGLDKQQEKIALKRKRDDTEKSKKCHNKIIAERNDPILMSDISESLNSTCDSLTTPSGITTNKSDILENEYEEFLKAVTSDISNSNSVPKEKKMPVKKKKRQEIKKSKQRKRRRYSTSSSSSSDSYDSDSSSSSSSSSSYSSSSSSSASSYDVKKKRRKMRTKQKRKECKEGKDKIIKIEMTHSIVKDLDDLQPFPISKTPIVQIKQEQEDPSYSAIATVIPPTMKETDVNVPLPVPSPSIVPPPLLNILSIKQEKPDSSISSKADSTTSPAKKGVPLIPTKFIAPTPRKEVPASICSNSAVALDTDKKNETSPKVIEALPPQPVNHCPFYFSIPYKQRTVINESTNDSDSQDFTEYFSKKSENLIKSNQNNDAVKVNEIQSEIFVESSMNQIDLENIEKSKNTEVSIPHTEPISPDSKESDNKTDDKISYPARKSSPDKPKLSSPVRKNVSPKRHSSPSPRDKRKSSGHSDSFRRSPRKSVSPKYRNLSPRGDSLSRKRSRDLSPAHRRNPRYRDNSLSRGISPRRKTFLDTHNRRRESPSLKNRTSHSSRNRTSMSPRHRRSVSPTNRSPHRTRRSPSSRGRKTPSPRIRRSSSPRFRNSVSPTSYRSSYTNYSPNQRCSPSSKSHRRTYSRSISVERKKETIQQTLQRLAGVDEYSQIINNKSSINSPVEGFKRSVADSTISDDQLLQQNSIESTDSPAYKAPSARLVHSPSSPKRLPLDVRINQVLGLDKQSPEQITSYTQTYTYEQYAEHYGQYYGQNVMHRDNYSQPPPPPVPKPQGHVGSSKVVQIGNVLQVVPTEEIPQQEVTKQPPLQKIVQVGNMLQIVPTPASHMPKETMVPPPVNVSNLSSSLTISQPPPPPSLPDNSISGSSTHEKLSPEEQMLQKIAERRAERAKRHEEREKKRKEKEKRRKEKEKKKQLRLKIKTENMIKNALRIETEALAMGENLDDNEENIIDSIPSCWPSASVISNSLLKPAGKGILVRHGVSKFNIEDENEQRKLKSVKFADGVVPGEGTSPSGGEELSSPPPPKEKRFKKMKKKIQKKKKIKVKIIRKSCTESPDDEDLDNLPPPSPPPGSPPPHIYPARIKTHTINNIHPTYATGVPLMTVGSYPPQFRPNIPMALPPPMHNLPQGPHHGPSGPRAPSQIISQHGPPLHGPIQHGVSSGLPHGISSHSHGPPHHSSGPRL